MNPVKIILGFVPFLLFSVLGRWLSIEWAAAAALIAAVALLVYTARAGITILPLAQTVILAVIAIAAAVGGSDMRSFLTLNARGGASLLLGVLIVATASFAPFTAKLAGNSVPSQVRTSPAFLAVNRRISLAWGAAVLVLGVCHIAAAHLDAHGGRPIVVVAIAWVVPILALLRALSFTRGVVASASAARPAPAAQQAPRT